MGSAVLNLPLLQKLRSFYPEARIDILVTPNTRGIFTRTPLVNGNIINLFSLQGLWQIFRVLKAYDLVIDTEEYFSISSLVTFYCGKYRIGFDTMASRKNAYHRAIPFNDTQHISDTYLDLVRIGFNAQVSPVESLIPIVVPAHVEHKVKTYLQSLPVYSRLIGIHPGGSTTAPERFWSVNRWTALCSLVLSYDPEIFILMTGTELEKIAHSQILQGLSNSTRIVSTIGDLP